MFLHRHAAAQPAFVHHAANLRHLPRARIQRQRDVEIRIGFSEHALQIVGVGAVAVRAPVRVVDAERLGAIADGDVRLVACGVRRARY